MSSHPPIPRGRTLILLLIVALCAGLGAGGTLLLSPFGGSQPAAAATARPDSDAAIYSRLEPSVVDVTATLRGDGETASGTGFVVDARAGLVLTNYHVIRDAASVVARLTSTGQTYRARIVGSDAAADIAVLQLRGATGLTAAPLSGSAAVAVGTPVLAIGNRAGQDGSPASAPGLINGLNRTIRAYDGLSQSTETLHGMLETSARIVPGDSGGPLAGPAGTVIGIDTAAGAGTRPAGYAIPIAAAMAIERRIAAEDPGPGIAIGVSP
jgi:S1-C subfamily serine protease